MRTCEKQTQKSEYKSLSIQLYPYFDHASNKGWRICVYAQTRMRLRCSKMRKVSNFRDEKP